MEISYKIGYKANGAVQLWLIRKKKTNKQTKEQFSPGIRKKKFIQPTRQYCRSPDIIALAKCSVFSFFTANFNFGPGHCTGLREAR